LCVRYVKSTLFIKECIMGYEFEWMIELMLNVVFD
jgi:hypothetical protein